MPAPVGAVAVLGALAMLGTGPAAAQGTPTGRMLADTCGVCHGTDGRAVRGMEGLAGKGANELVDEFREMRARPGESRLMAIIARGFTDAEVRRMGEHFATLPRR